MDCTPDDENLPGAFGRGVWRKAVASLAARLGEPLMAAGDSGASFELPGYRVVLSLDQAVGCLQMCCVMPGLWLTEDAMRRLLLANLALDGKPIHFCILPGDGLAQARMSMPLAMADGAEESCAVGMLEALVNACRDACGGMDAVVPQQGLA